WAGRKRTWRDAF
nr:Chain B, A58NLS [synthetic construct]3ZIP_C Chain C, A58NLS [synthetic construct]